MSSSFYGAGRTLLEHTHEVTDIIGLDEFVQAAAAAGHNHEITDIVGLEGQLAGLQTAVTTANTSLTSKASVTALQAVETQLSDLLAAVPTISEVDGLPARVTTLETTTAQTTLDLAALTLLVANLPQAQTAAKRFWRVRATESFTGTDYVQIFELDFKNGSGVSLLTSYQIISGSFDGNSTAPHQAFDGSNSDHWQSASGSITANTAWIGVGFPGAGPETVEQIDIRSNFGTTQNLPTDFVIESSTDLNDWSLEWSVTGASWGSSMTFQTNRTGTLGTPVITGSSPGAKRYWRVKATSIFSGSSQMEISRFTLHDSAVGSNLATVPAQAITGSAEAGRPVSNAIAGQSGFYQNDDGSFETGDAWFGYDFDSSPIALRKVVISTPSSSDDGPAGFTVDWSDDGVTWTTAYTVTGAQWGTDHDFEFNLPA